jgi:hypothetical protein
LRFSFQSETFPSPTETASTFPLTLQLVFQTASANVFPPAPDDEGGVRGVDVHGDRAESWVWIRTVLSCVIHKQAQLSLSLMNA